MSRRLLRSASRSFHIPIDRRRLSLILIYRLRQVDVKAEHFERQVQRLEQERDSWEKKYEVCVSPLTIARHSCCCSLRLRHWIDMKSLILVSLFHRKPKLNTSNLRRSLTNLFQAWKVFSSSSYPSRLGLFAFDFTSHHSPSYLTTVYKPLLRFFISNYHTSCNLTTLNVAVCVNYI